MSVFVDFEAYPTFRYLVCPGTAEVRKVRVAEETPVRRSRTHRFRSRTPTPTDVGMQVCDRPARVGRFASSLQLCEALRTRARWMAPLGLFIAACTIPPVCVGCIAVLLWRRHNNDPRTSVAERRSTLRGPTRTDPACEAYLPTAGQPGALQMFDSADSKDGRASPVARSYANMRSSGPRIAIAKNGTRVLARKSATERRLVERARKDKSRFGVGAQDSTEFEMVPTLEDDYWPESARFANADTGDNRHPNGLRRRGVTWTPQRLDGFSLSGYLPPSLGLSFTPSSDDRNRMGDMTRLAGHGLFLPEGVQSSTGCSGETGHAPGSSESAEPLVERRQPDHAKDPSFGTDLFRALGLDGGHRSTSTPPQEGSRTVSGPSLTDLPPERAPNRPARPGPGDIVNFDAPSGGLSRREASERTQPSMLSLSRWEAYGQVQDALQQLPPGHSSELVETLDEVEEAGPVSPRRKDSVPWFAANAPPDSDGLDDNGDSESELEAARLQEQRSAERMFEHARRPISWLPRQSSNGTLPGIASFVGNLEVRSVPGPRPSKWKADERRAPCRSATPMNGRSVARARPRPKFGRRSSYMPGRTRRGYAMSNRAACTHCQSRVAKSRGEASLHSIKGPIALMFPIPARC